MRWSDSLRSTRVARGLVGRMFSIRFGRFTLLQILLATSAAWVRSRRE